MLWKLKLIFNVREPYYYVASFAGGKRTNTTNACKGWRLIIMAEIIKRAERKNKMPII
jgi:hypothetical protein